MNDPKPEPPLTEASTYILLSLAPAEKHGYAILKDVAALSQGRVRLSTSTLYSALDRLQAQGLIERLEAAAAPSPGLPRKTYRLSGAGRAAVEAEMARLKRLLSAGEGRLAGPPVG